VASAVSNGVGVYGWFSLRVGLTREPADAFGLSFERFVGLPEDGTHRSGGEPGPGLRQQFRGSGPPSRQVRATPDNPEVDRKGWR